MIIYLNMLKGILYGLLSCFGKSLLSLFFPRVCCVCGEYLSGNEELVCVKCLCELPKTNYHLYKDNPVAYMFYGRVNIHAAASYFHFVKSSKYSRMMYRFKYEGMKEIGVALGKYFGRNLAESHLFSDVDIIVPVPLHRKKLRERGYNQSECIARGMSASMGVCVACDNLIRKEFTPTQTRKSRTDRWDNVKGKFIVVDPVAFTNRHILLVDDVITTGATIEACAAELLKIQGVTVSIATLAKA